MSTIDIGAIESTPSRPHTPRAMASPASPRPAADVDAGDFYIGSTKISALPPLHTAQAARHSPAN